MGIFGPRNKFFKISDPLLWRFMKESVIDGRLRTTAAMAELGLLPGDDQEQLGD